MRTQEQETAHWHFCFLDTVLYEGISATEFIQDITTTNIIHEKKPEICSSKCHVQLLHPTLMLPWEDTGYEVQRSTFNVFLLPWLASQSPNRLNVLYTRALRPTGPSTSESAHPKASRILSITQLESNSSSPPETVQRQVL